MDEFMVNNMTEHFVSFERNHHPILKEFRYTANPFFQVFRQDIRLLKIIVRIVDHNRDAIIDLISKAFADESIGRFSGGRGKVRKVFAIIAEIYVEMIRLDVPPFELFVFTLFLPKTASWATEKNTPAVNRNPIIKRRNLIESSMSMGTATLLYGSTLVSLITTNGAGRILPMLPSLFRLRRQLRFNAGEINFPVFNVHFDYFNGNALAKTKYQACCCRR